MDTTTLQQDIGSAVKTATNIAEIIAPEYAGFIALGQVMATAYPELFKDIMTMIHEGEPTAEDQAALAGKIAGLADPEDL